MRSTIFDISGPSEILESTGQVRIRYLLKKHEDNFSEKPSRIVEFKHFLMPLCSSFDGKVMVF